MIPASVRFDQSTMASLLEVDPLVQEYRAFFSLLDWSVVERWQAQRSACYGSHGHPLTTYIKAFLLRIKEGLIYAKQLRAFLLNHPLLVIELGFNLELDESADYGFDVQRTLPCRYWFGEKLRQLDRALLQDLLAATVVALKKEIPGLGEVVAFDVKHIYAWVKENNERTYVKDRYDKTKQLAGDPDCKLGVKRSSNQEQPDGSTKEKKEYIWGYGSGVAAATVAGYGDVVMADLTQALTRMMSPIIVHYIIRLLLHSTNFLSISQLMPLLMLGMCMMMLLAMEALLLYRSISMDIPSIHAIPMECRSVP